MFLGDKERSNNSSKSSSKIVVQTQKKHTTQNSQNHFQLVSFVHVLLIVFQSRVRGD